MMISVLKNKHYTDLATTLPLYFQTTDDQGILMKCTGYCQGYV